MFTASDKTVHTPAVQQKTAANSFFRKAGEESFFGQKQSSFFGATLQPKLTVSTPDDPQEKEADAVADKVMTMPDPLQASAIGRTEEQVQKHEEEDKPRQEIGPAVQRKCGCEEKVQAKAATIPATNTPSAQGALIDLAQEGSTQRIDRKHLSLYDSDIQRQSGRGPPATSPSFEQSLQSTKGGGSALPGDTKGFMESRFDADFSGVRIHTGSQAEQLTTHVQAQAFAHGNDIYFNSGKFSPDSASGRTLLAHELTHTIQQGASSPKPAAKKIGKADISGSRNITSTPSTQLQKKREIAAARPINDKEAENIQNRHNKVEKASEPVTVQPKTQLSKLSVDANGHLQASTAKVVQKNSEEKDLRKTEDEQVDRESVAPDKRHDIQTRSGQFNNSSVQPGKPGGIGMTNDDAGVQSKSSGIVQRYSSDMIATDNLVRHDRGPPVQRKLYGSVDIVQPSLIDGAMSRISEFLTLPGITDLTDPKGWLLGKVRQFASYIPGYRALGVVIGHDPITGAEVPQNGKNFIEAALDIIPGGTLIKQKLEELGLLDQAATWFDTQIATLKGIVAGVSDEFNNAWNAVNATSILDGPTAIVRSLGGILERALNNIIDFARRAATELIDIVKKFLLTHIVAFVKEHTNAYDLLKVIMGKDPITDERVERNGTTILNALLELGGEAGREQLRQMQETHTFEKAAAWINRGIGVFGDLYDAIKNGYKMIWDAVSIEALMHPADTFNRIYEKFAGPVTRVLAFVTDTLKVILGYIKEALMAKLSAWAKTIRGYSLVTVIIGKDPFTNATVPRSVENIIKGFMSLMDGGEEQFAQLQQSGAIGRAAQRINAAVARLNMTPEFIIQLFLQLWESFSFADLTRPQEAFERIMAKFGEPIGRLISFVVEIIRIVIEVVMQVMNFPSDLIANIIAKAMQAIEMIKRDPVGFLKNLLRAIKQGFIQFFGNIGKHLLAGLQGWLMSELKDSGVAAPTDFSLRGIISWVLQLLGITMEKIWEKLAQHPRIGPQKVARIRGMINTLEGIWTFIKDVQQRGMAAIWDKIQEKLTNLWDTIIDAIKNWIMEKIVTQVTAKLLSMLDPTGIMAVINSAIAIYKAVQSFIRYLRQMLEIVNSFVEGVVQIASGNISVAANFMERSMARGVPIMIGFLANQVGLGGLGKRVGEMIENAKVLVDEALTWLVNKAVDTGMALLDRVMAAGRSAVDAGRSAVSSVIGWARGLLGLEKRFTTADNRPHRIFYRASGNSVALMLNPDPERNFIDAMNSITVDPNAPPVLLATAISVPLKQNGAETGRVNVGGSVTMTILKAKALEVATHIQQVIQRVAADPSKQQQLENIGAGSSQQTADFAVSLDGLAEITKYLLGVSGAGGPLPVTPVPEYGPLRNGFGTRMRIFPLTKLGTPGSTVAVVNNVYTDLLHRRRTAGGVPTYYVAGHLLNNNVHGSGTTWQNLTPLSQTANQEHERKVESKVKEATDRDLILDYTVEVDYQRSLNQTLINQIVDPAELWKRDPIKSTKHKIVSAEAHIPSKLMCTVKQKKADGTDVTAADGSIHHPEYNISGSAGEIENRIEESHLGNYNLADINATTYLTLIELQRLSGSALDTNKTWSDFYNDRSNKPSIDNLKDTDRSELQTPFQRQEYIEAEQQRIRELRELTTWNSFNAGRQAYTGLITTGFTMDVPVIQHSFFVRMNEIKRDVLLRAESHVEAITDKNKRWQEVRRVNRLEPRPGVFTEDEIQTFKRNHFDRKMAQLNSATVVST